MVEDETLEATKMTNGPKVDEKIFIRWTIETNMNESKVYPEKETDWGKIYFRQDVCKITIGS